MGRIFSISFIQAQIGLLERDRRLPHLPNFLTVEAILKDRIGDYVLVIHILETRQLDGSRKTDEVFTGPPSRPNVEYREECSEY